VMGFFQDRFSWTIWLGCLQTSVLLISASWVAGITGMSSWHYRREHRQLARFFIFNTIFPLRTQTGRLSRLFCLFQYCFFILFFHCKGQNLSHMQYKHSPTEPHSQPLVFRNRVSLCSPGWPRTHSAPASTSWVLGSQVYATTPGFLYFLIRVQLRGQIVIQAGWSHDTSSSQPF
jgi:hypothetical protein